MLRRWVPVSLWQRPTRVQVQWPSTFGGFAEPWVRSSSTFSLKCKGNPGLENRGSPQNMCHPSDASTWVMGVSPSPADERNFIAAADTFSETARHRWRNTALTAPGLHLAQT